MEIVTDCGVGRAGRAHGRAWNQVKSSRVESSRMLILQWATLRHENWLARNVLLRNWRHMSRERHKVDWESSCKRIYACCGRVMRGVGRGMKDRLLKVVITETERALAWAARTHFGHMSSG